MSYELPWDLSSNSSFSAPEFYSRFFKLLKKIDIQRPFDAGFQFFSFTTSRTIPSLSKEGAIRDWQLENYSLLIEPFKEKLAKISFRQDDWDHAGSLKPKIGVISQAHTALESFLYTTINEGLIWHTPLISSDEEGNIVIEWHHGAHELHVDIDEDGMEYIKVWGANIQSEMHVNSLNASEFLNLWKWLLNG